MHEFDTEIVATHYLKKNGYTELFHIKDQVIELRRLSLKYTMEELVEYKNIQLCKGDLCRQLVAIKTNDGKRGIAFGAISD